MKTLHTPHHWFTVALVLAAALFTITEVYGQNSGAAAVFEGRPAMSGAQAGQGAMAGPPQGGLGVQAGDGVRRGRDTSVAKDERSGFKKSKRAAKRIVKRARTGVGDIDASQKVGGQGR